jgi:hypothetical protein
VSSLVLTLLGVFCGMVGAIFGAGIVFSTMQTKIEKARTDVNQLGKKYGRLVSLLILWADTPEKREQLSRATEPQW